MPIPNAICGNCSTPMWRRESAGPRAFCSLPECRKAGARLRARDRRPPALHETVCRYCGDGFISTNSRRTFCYGAACNRAHQARRQREGGYSTKSRAKLGRSASTVAADKRRKALLRGAVGSNKFTSSEVFDRDNWMCGICLAPVDPTTSYPDPMSVSLDHVQAIALGGSHTFDNVRCSHLVCNVRRQTGVNDATRTTTVRDIRRLQEASA